MRMNTEELTETATDAAHELCDELAVLSDGELSTLAGLNEVRRYMESAMRRQVQEARDAGSTWSSIGRALRISAASARARYAKH